MTTKRLTHAQALALNSWLAKSDAFYVDGRHLWFSYGHDGATVLLWLSLEQLMKALVFQSKFQRGEITTQNFDSLFRILDSEGRKLNHGLTAIDEVNVRYKSLLTTKDRQALETLNVQFNRRYVTNTTSVMSIDLIRLIDRIFFKLRDRVSSKVVLTYIDEIGFRRAAGFQHQLEEHMQFAYLDNPYFRRRKKYPTHRIRINDTHLYVDSGRRNPIRYEKI